MTKQEAQRFVELQTKSLDFGSSIPGQIKSLGHVFHLKGKGPYPPDKLISYEGMFLDNALAMLAAQFNAYVYTHACQTINHQLKTVNKSLHNCWLMALISRYSSIFLTTDQKRNYFGNTLLDIYRNHMLTMAVGWQGHAVGLVLWDEWLLRCNGGSGAKSEVVIEVYSIGNRNNITPKLLADLAIYSGAKQNVWLLQSGIHSILNLKLHYKCYGPQQRVGNCCYFSSRLMMHAALAMAKMQIHPDKTVKDHLHSSSKLSREFIYFLEQKILYTNILQQTPTNSFLSTRLLMEAAYKNILLDEIDIDNLAIHIKRSHDPNLYRLQLLEYYANSSSPLHIQTLDNFLSAYGLTLDKAFTDTKFSATAQLYFYIYKFGKTWLDKNDRALITKLKEKIEHQHWSFLAYNPLQYALVLSSKLSLIALLCDLFPECLNQKTFSGHYTLGLAHNIQEANILIKAGAMINPNHWHIDSHTPLNAFIEKKKEELAVHFLDNGAIANKYTAIHAVKFSSVKLVKMILGKFPGLVKSKDLDFKDLLNIACANHPNDAILHTYLRSVLPNHKPDVNGNFGPHTIAEHSPRDLNHLTINTLMMFSESERTAKNNNGETPLAIVYGTELTLPQTYRHLSPV